jgi:hypothetical protein
VLRLERRCDTVSDERMATEIPDVLPGYALRSTPCRNDSYYVANFGYSFLQTKQISFNPIISSDLLFTRPASIEGVSSDLQMMWVD